jgi:hypothetical protein
MIWSYSLGLEATTVFFLAAIGAILATMGNERSRREKRDRPQRSNEAGRS